MTVNGNRCKCDRKWVATSPFVCQLCAHVCVCLYTLKRQSSVLQLCKSFNSGQRRLNNLFIVPRPQGGRNVTFSFLILPPFLSVPIPQHALVWTRGLVVVRCARKNAVWLWVEVDEETLRNVVGFFKHFSHSELPSFDFPIFFFFD